MYTFFIPSLLEKSRDFLEMGGFHERGLSFIYMSFGEIIGG